MQLYFGARWCPFALSVPDARASFASDRTGGEVAGSRNIGARWRARATALTYSTLGPDLYGGTSGVALFLAELAAVTGDELFRRTAIGTIAHALARAPDLAVNLDCSLYSGRVGIAVAAAAVG